MRVEMSDSITKLNCASCGANLDVYDDMQRFACGFCGIEMVVQRRGENNPRKSLETHIPVLALLKTWQY